MSIGVSQIFSSLNEIAKEHDLSLQKYLNYKLYNLGYEHENAVAAECTRPGDVMQ